MSEPHIIVEREVSYEDFVALVTQNDISTVRMDYIRDDGGILPGHHFTYYSVRDGVLYMDRYDPYKIDPEYNQTIQYGQGYFYLNKKVFDKTESDEMNDDGYYNWITLDTFTIQRYRFSLHKLYQPSFD